ncbi:hypothetical protein V1514DRAFT_340225 [Lipomyces japonicus]|uniref:uncharacterized protein n=1 Tax=Lipomyces japonicus TaxID=56871 RepID=UPI0034CEC991
MAQLNYVTLDVFTSTQFSGNQLAIVLLGKDDFTPEKKLKITKEFNFSETVFLHDEDDNGEQRIEIYTKKHELPFAGHPVIGTAHYIFTQIEKTKNEVTVVSKAGPIKLSFDRVTSHATADVPFNIHIHGIQTPTADILQFQPQLEILESSIAKLKDSYPAVSIVKGLSFNLIDFTNTPELLAALKPAESAKATADEGWGPTFTGSYYYELLENDPTRPAVRRIKSRMIFQGIEDPATGSAASALSAYLALTGEKNQENKYSFEVTQGVEYGRPSAITVTVELNTEGTEVQALRLSGQAALVTKGTFF